MRIGFIGLGRMGANMVRRLVRDGHEIVIYNRTPEKTREIAAEDSGEGRWTVQEAIDHDVPAPVITLSLLTRFRSRQTDSYGAKVLAALRNEFGGHAVKTE